MSLISQQNLYCCKHLTDLMFLLKQLRKIYKENYEFMADDAMFIDEELTDIIN